MGGANPQQEVREERKTAMTGYVRYSVNKHTNDLRDNALYGGHLVVLLWAWLVAGGGSGGVRGHEGRED